MTLDKSYYDKNSFEKNDMSHSSIILIVFVRVAVNHNYHISTQLGPEYDLTFYLTTASTSKPVGAHLFHMILEKKGRERDSVVPHY
jgi:hypothetical protein